MPNLASNAVRISLVSALVAGMSWHAGAAPPAEAWMHEPAPVVMASVPAPRPSRLRGSGWQASVDLLHYKPRIRGLDYATLDYGNALALGTGSIKHLEYADDVGVRAALKYQTKTGWGVGCQLMKIDFSGIDSVSRPPDAGQLFATRVHPDSNQETETASAQGALRFRVADLMASRTAISSEFGSLETFGGFRWAEIGQSLAFDYDGRDFLEGHVDQDQVTHAFGLKMGASSTWKWANGFGLNGSFAGSLLHGRFDTHSSEDNVFGTQLMAEMSDDFNDLISVLELSVGASWECSWMSVSAGYDMSGWFNANNREMFVDDQHEGVIAPFSNDILLQGYFVRLTAWL